MNVYKNIKVGKVYPDAPSPPPNQKKVSTSSPCVYLTPNATATFVNPHEFFSSGEQTRL